MISYYDVFWYNIYIYVRIYILTTVWHDDYICNNPAAGRCYFWSCVVWLGHLDMVSSKCSTISQFSIKLYLPKALVYGITLEVWSYASYAMQPLYPIQHWLWFVGMTRCAQYHQWSIPVHTPVDSRRPRGYRTRIEKYRKAEMTLKIGLGQNSDWG